MSEIFLVKAVVGSALKIGDKIWSPKAFLLITINEIKYEFKIIRIYYKVEGKNMFDEYNSELPFLVQVPVSNPQIIFFTNFNRPQPSKDDISFSKTVIIYDGEGFVTIGWFDFKEDKWNYESDFEMPKKFYWHYPLTIPNSINNINSK